MVDISSLLPWQIYLVLAILLMTLEVFVPGFILFPIGFAFLVTCGAAFLIPSVPLQLCIFAVVCVLTFWVGQRWLRREGQNAPIRTNVDGMVGQEGIVEEEINYEKRTGYVKIYGDSWRANCVQREVIPVGSRVIVEYVDGNQIYVRVKA